MVFLVLLCLSVSPIFFFFIGYNKYIHYILKYRLFHVVCFFLGICYSSGANRLSSEAGHSAGGQQRWTDRSEAPSQKNQMIP